MSNSYLLLSPGLSAGVLLKICSEGLFHHLWKPLSWKLKKYYIKSSFFFFGDWWEKKKKDTWAEMKIRAFVCFIGFLDWPCNMLSPLHFAQKVVKKRPLIPLFKIYIIWVCTKVASQVVVWAFGRDQIMNSVTNLCFAHSKGLLLFEFLWVILFTFISHDTHMSLGCK